MSTLAILVALGWFWLTFYATGPLTSWTDLITGGSALVVGCAVFALWGAWIGSRRGRR